MAKSIGIAFVLGLVAAGLGHVYTGYLRRGIAFLLVDGILVAQMIASPPNAGFGAVILLAIYAWSLADLHQIFKKDETLTVSENIACSKCGFKNGLTTEYCIKCGSKIQNNCPKCGQLTTPQMTFCGKCGSALTV